jgi:hypothetical protein
MDGLAKAIVLNRENQRSDMRPMDNLRIGNLVPNTGNGQVPNTGNAEVPNTGRYRLFGG